MLEPSPACDAVRRGCTLPQPIVEAVAAGTDLVLFGSTLTAADELKAATVKYQSTPSPSRGWFRPRPASRGLGTSVAVTARSLTVKVADGAAVVVLALAVGFPTALAESQSPRSGVLSVSIYGNPVGLAARCSGS